ncbi:MAG TPA: hypothetical protein VJU85_01650, partial [Nitrososphaeraceae archaeon]|nr:hypothetical protein [Nitrososphaeraceae archaeon]
KQIVNFKVKRLEYELKVEREIEHTSKIVYQLEMLECCKIIINWDLQRRTRKEEYNIIHFSNIETIIKQTEQYSNLESSSF